MALVQGQPQRLRQALNLTPDEDERKADDEETVTWQPQRGLVFKIITWAILIGFALCVLLSVAVLLSG